METNPAVVPLVFFPTTKPWFLADYTVAGCPLEYLDTGWAPFSATGVKVSSGRSLPDAVFVVPSLELERFCRPFDAAGTARFPSFSTAGRGSHPVGSKRCVELVVSGAAFAGAATKDDPTSKSIASPEIDVLLFQAVPPTLLAARLVPRLDAAQYSHPSPAPQVTHACLRFSQPQGSPFISERSDGDP